MNKLCLTLFTAVSWFMTSSVAAGECDRIAAENLNSSIRANFTLMKDFGKHDGLEPEEIDRLRQDFEASRKRHVAALQNGDQESLNKVCDDYRSILSQQETMGK